MKPIHFCLIIFVTVFFSCKEDKVSIEFDQLPGRWTLAEAQRDGKVTGTLDNAFFIIDESNFSHNLNGDSIGVTYTLVDNVLTINDELMKTLEITSLKADTLRAKTKIGSFNFKFLMIKDGAN